MLDNFVDITTMAVDGITGHFPAEQITPDAAMPRHMEADIDAISEVSSD